MKYQIIILLFFFLYLPAQQKQEKFNFWGASQFKFGMNESDVINIIKNQNLSYHKKEVSRIESAILVADQIKDTILLDGKISICFHFKGRLYKDKYLELIRIMWVDWENYQDNSEAENILNKKFLKIIGKPHIDRFDNKYWKYFDGYISIFKPGILQLYFKKEMGV